MFQLERLGYFLWVGDAAAVNRPDEGERLSALGQHLWAADRYRGLAEAADRAGRYDDADRYRELALLEVRLDRKATERA